MNTPQTPEQLTVKEAIEQGYTICGVDQSGEVMPRKIERFGSHEFEEAQRDGYSVVLFEKEPRTMSVCDYDIYNDLAENFAISNEISDDNDMYGDLIRDAVNWQEIADKINAELAKHPVYFPTEIKLLP